MSKVVDSDERRRELAAAAARVIARSGTDGASMRNVAAEAGWTTGVLAHYFTNKRELLSFTLLSSLEARRTGRPGPDVRPDEAIRAKLVRALPIDDESRLHWTVTVAFASYAASDPELATVQRDAYRTSRDHLIELLGTATASPNSADALSEAERLFALVDGIALQALFDPESWPADRQLAALDAGLTPPGAST